MTRLQGLQGLLAIAALLSACGDRRAPAGDGGGACSGLGEVACQANPGCAPDYCSVCGCVPAPYVGCRDRSAPAPQCLQAPCVANACDRGQPDAARPDAARPDAAPLPDRLASREARLASEGEACGDDVAIQIKCLPGLICAPLQAPPSEHSPGTCVKPAQKDQDCNTTVSTSQGEVLLPCADGLVCCYPCGIPGCQDRCMVPCTGSACSNGCPMLP